MPMFSSVLVSFDIMSSLYVLVDIFVNSQRNFNNLNLKHFIVSSILDIIWTLTYLPMSHFCLLWSDFTRVSQNFKSFYVVNYIYKVHWATLRWWGHLRVTSSSFPNPTINMFLKSQGFFHNCTSNFYMYVKLNTPSLPSLNIKF